MAREGQAGETQVCSVSHWGHSSVLCLGQQVTVWTPNTWTSNASSGSDPARQTGGLVGTATAISVYTETDEPSLQTFGDS